MIFKFVQDAFKGEEGFSICGFASYFLGFQILLRLVFWTRGACLRAQLGIHSLGPTVLSPRLACSRFQQRGLCPQLRVAAVLADLLPNDSWNFSPQGVLGRDAARSARAQ
jgi:hypothetical protein